MIKSLILIAFIVQISAAGVASSPIEKPERILKEINRTKKQLQIDEVKERKVLSALYVINKKMKKIESERGSLSREQMLVEQAIAELNPKISTMETTLKQKKSLLRERMRVIYKLGGQGLARILFTSKSSFELEKNLKVIGLIASNDIKLIKEHNFLLHELERKKTKLASRLSHLQSLTDKISGKEQQLVEQNHSKQKLLTALRNSQKFNSKKISEIRRQTAKNAGEDYQGLMDLLLRPSFVENKGKLSPPVKGAISRRYGLEAVTDHKYVRVNSRGLSYMASQGATVNTIFDGKVAFVGSVEGHGQTIIVDHGDHYYTVYGNLSETKVKDGDEVRQNSALGKVGSLNADLEGNLYFEIRHFSEPYDPTTWMRGTTL